MVKFGYDDHLQRNTTTWPGSSKRIEVYNTTHQLVRTSFTNSSHNNAFWRNYSYDKLGRISQEDLKYGSGTEIHTFAYDSLGQLRSAKEATSSQTTTCPEPTGTQIIYDGNDCTSSMTQTVTSNETLLYDAAGNLTSSQDAISGASAAPTYATANRPVTWSTATYEHDLDGNRARRLKGTSDTRYGWDAEGRLTSVTVGSRVVNYDYDAVGRLVRRRIGGTVDRLFLWDGDQLLAELNGTATSRVAEYAYLPGIDRPLALVTGATAISATRFYHQDALGNVDGVFTTTGVAQNVNYDVWGQWFDNPALADTNRLRWKGLIYERDSTKLYYMRNRWYDPETGRFMTEDPLGLAGGMNLYVFAGNDHVNSSDPYGLCDDPRSGNGWALQNEIVVCAEKWPFSTPKGSGATGNFGNPNARGGGRISVGDVPGAGGGGNPGGAGNEQTNEQCIAAIAEALVTVAGDAAVLIPGGYFVGAGAKALRSGAMARRSGLAGSQFAFDRALREARMLWDHADDLRATAQAQGWWATIRGSEAAVAWTGGAWVEGLKQGAEGIFPTIAPFIPGVASIVAGHEAFKACK